jgi:hypothetical protein
VMASDAVIINGTDSANGLIRSQLISFAILLNKLSLMMITT